MSEEQHDQQPDMQEPSEERQAELQVAYEKNIAAGRAPYQHVRFMTLGEIVWVMQEHDWSGDRELAYTGRTYGEAPDFRQASFQGLRLQGAQLAAAQLRGADFSGADMRNANLLDAHLEEANLDQANLAGATILYGYLQRAYLKEAHLEKTNLNGVFMEEALLDDAHLEGATIREANLEGVSLRNAHLEHADLYATHLEGANLRNTRMQGAALERVYLAGADMREANLEGADLQYAYLQARTLTDTDLERIRTTIPKFPQVLPPADLRNAILNFATKLNSIHLSDGRRAVALADIYWGGVNLTVVDWSQIGTLDDEYQAHDREESRNNTQSYSYRMDKYGERVESPISRQQKVKTLGQRIQDYEVAVRTNRQMAVALRDQGMNDQADYFAYRARRCQQTLRRIERNWGAYIGASILESVSGYGYRPGRTFVAYLLVVSGFAAAYYAATRFLGTQYAKLSWDESLVLSLTSFHGRGFFPGYLQLNDWVARIGAVEAVIGLFIELTLIATFSRRFLGD